MQNENYTRHMVVGLLLTLVLMASLGVAFVRETGRIEAVAATAQKKSLQHGRQLFVDNCTSCHGTRGEGGAGAVLNNSILLKKASNEVLFAAIVAGRPSTIMPAWGQANGGAFTDEDIRDIVTFIRAWEPTAPEVQAAVFVPNPARGAAIYTYGCYLCHGEDGKGGSNISVNSPSASGAPAVIAPAINVSAQLSKYDDDWYRQTIVNGRPAKGMPSWGGILSSNQIDDLVSVIAAWRNGERVVPEITVAELLNSALFSLTQNDAEDALFYLDRARAIAFGPAMERFAPIVEQVKNKQVEPARVALDALSKEWPLGDAASGETIFMDACKGCHGAEGQGGVGRKLKPNTFVQTTTNADLFIFLRTGRTGTAMRSFAGRLSESQLADVIAFLRTWQP